MRLVYSPVNAAWVFMFGSSPVRMEGWPMFFTERPDAVWAARDRGLAVAKDGTVSTTEGAAQ